MAPPRDLPPALRRLIDNARTKWTHTGQQRPPFAVDPDEHQESVWDYPRPPAVVADTRRVQVGPAQDLIADSTSAVRVLETASPPTFYIPTDDIRLDRLEVVAGTSLCEWKGNARYWAVAGETSLAVAWDYPKPFSAFTVLADHLAFYPGRIRCTVDGEIVRPQAGGFYGGWITDEIVGPFKGEPGTEGW